MRPKDEALVGVWLTAARMKVLRTRREAPVSHEGREIRLPYDGPGALGIGKPLKSISI
jgi:hypothetical protein